MGKHLTIGVFAPAVIVAACAIGGALFACFGFPPHESCSAGEWEAIVVLEVIVGVGLSLAVASRPPPSERNETG